MEKDKTPKPKKPRGIARTVLMGQRFWQQAERDLESARLMLQPRCYYVAVYLAHQASEKALKAAHWHLRGEEPPWRHDLWQCAEGLVESSCELPQHIDEAIAYLEPMLVRSRYPSGEKAIPIPAELIDGEDAEMSISAAEEVMTWVQTLLQQPPGKTRLKKTS
ncbi:MAG: HEPN domain-containing protein [Dehalococcoidia bacterium]|nr:HEPN domain-containing protein [Dehalococcoidia bacterium]